MILNYETASLLRAGALGHVLMDAEVGRAHVAGVVLWGGQYMYLESGLPDSRGLV